MKPSPAEPVSFRKALLAWYTKHRRDLPWRQSTDLYRVWLSEIMLQQTRVEAVIPYYERFLARFPTLSSLAQSEEEPVLAAWSGLGYYSRARNLRRAMQIAGENPPQTHAALLELPGIGTYTAAAIASISLGLPHAAVDGNVIRVIARLTNDPSEVSSPQAKKAFAAEATRLLDPRRPGDFNQAMMELGATVCLPRNPLCPRCPVARFCQARAAGTQHELPVKARKQAARDVELHLALLEKAGRVYFVRRDAAERRLPGFWELPQTLSIPGWSGEVSKVFRHQIVNDRFQVTVWRGRPSGRLPAGEWFDRQTWESLPLATLAKKALKSLP